MDDGPGITLIAVVMFFYFIVDFLNSFYLETTIPIYVLSVKNHQWVKHLLLTLIHP